MLTKVGVANTYEEITQDFIDFLQCQSADTQPWEKLSDKPQTYYGTTLAVPIDDYPIDISEKRKICIIPSSGVMMDRGTLFPNGEIMYYSLKKVLQHIFPNADVYEYEYNGSYYGHRKLESVYDSLQHVKDAKGSFPDVVICGGLDWTIKPDGTGIMSWNDYVKIELNNIYNYCKTNNIECCMVYAPELVKNQLVIDPSEGLKDKFDLTIADQYEYDMKRFISDTDETIFNITRWMLDSTGKDKIVDTLENFFVFSEEFNKWFETPMYTKMKIRLILNRFFHVSRPEFYVTLQDMKITGSTYSQFFWKEYQNEQINHVQRHKRSIHGHRGINLFKHTGELIAFGLHTSFDYGLWMCEQGGVTCRYEADRQINDADLLPFWDFRPTPYKRLDPPVFPGTGCPWLTIADRDKTEYHTNEIHYYFTKNNTNATITVRICDKYGIKPDCFQSVAFGKFESSPGYTMPLYVAGGTSALSPDVWV